MLRMLLDAEGKDEILLSGLLLGEFVTRNGIKLYDREDAATDNKADKTNIEEEAAVTIRKAFEGILGKGASKGEIAPDGSI